MAMAAATATTTAELQALLEPPHGCALVPRFQHIDFRGSLARMEKQSSNHQWAQVLHVRNVAHTVRGMHCAPCAKLVSVVTGSVWDVLVDLRPHSATYGCWWGTTLNDNCAQSLIVAAGVAHGYYSADASEMLYGVEHEYDPVKEIRLRFDDASVGIQWPITKSVRQSLVISVTDLSNPLLQHQHQTVLVYGGKGFLGSYISAHLKHSDFNVVLAVARAENRADVAAELYRIRPAHVISCIGVGGVPSATWHDDHALESTRGNILIPLTLLDVCNEQKVHCVVLGSGVVHSDTEVPQDELQPLKPSSSGWGKSRAMFEVLAKPYLDTNALLLRIMYPITGDGDIRCLLTKLRRCNKVHAVPTSVTVLPTLLPYLACLLKQRATGILNFVNPGTISPRDIVGLWRALNPADYIHSPPVEITSKNDNVAACSLSIARLRALTNNSMLDIDCKVTIERLIHALVPCAAL